LHRLNLNAPITIEWRPLRCLASRPELNTAIAVFIIEAAAAAPAAQIRPLPSDLGPERTPRSCLSTKAARERKPRAAVLIRKSAGRFVSV